MLASTTATSSCSPTNCSRRQHARGDRQIPPVPGEPINMRPRRIQELPILRCEVETTAAHEVTVDDRPDSQHHNPPTSVTLLQITVSPTSGMLRHSLVGNSHTHLQRGCPGLRGI